MWLTALLNSTMTKKPVKIPTLQLPGSTPKHTHTAIHKIYSFDHGATKNSTQHTFLSNFLAWNVIATLSVPSLISSARTWQQNNDHYNCHHQKKQTGHSRKCGGLSVLSFGGDAKKGPDVTKHVRDLSHASESMLSWQNSVQIPPTWWITERAVMRISVSLRSRIN